MNIDLLNASESVRLRALSTLDVRNAASAFKQWFADRSTHQLEAVNTQQNVLEWLTSDRGATQNELDQLCGTATSVDVDGVIAIIKYQYHVNESSHLADALIITVGNSSETWVLSNETHDMEVWFKVQQVSEPVLDLVDRLSDLLDTVTLESEALIDFDQNLLSAVQDSASNYDSIIAAGLNSTFSVVQTQASALSKVAAEGKTYAILAYIQDWFAKSYNVVDDAYQTNPDASAFSLGDYAPQEVSSLIAGAWTVITEAATMLGTILAVVGGAFAKAAGVIVMGLSSVANYFINKADQNEHLTIGSGKSYEYANGIPCVLGAEVKPQQDIWSVNKRCTNMNGTLMMTSNKDYNPKEFSYPCSSIWYPSALAYFVDSDHYMSALRAAYSKPYGAAPTYIRTSTYVRLTNPSDPDVLALTAADFDTVNALTAMQTATMRIRTEFSPTESNYQDDGHSIMINQYLADHTDTLFDHLTSDDNDRATADIYSRVGIVHNIMRKAWDVAMEIILRATSAKYDGNLIKFNATYGDTVYNFYDKFVAYFEANGWTNCGMPDQAKGRHALVELFTSFITGDATGFPRKEGEAIHVYWTWDDINDFLKSGFFFENNSSLTWSQITVLATSGSYGSFAKLVCALVNAFGAKVVTDNDYYNDLWGSSSAIRANHFCFAWIRDNDLFYNGQVGISDFALVKNPWIIITDDPCLITDPLVAPPKWKSGSTALAVLGIAVVIAAAVTTAVIASRAWKKHTVNKVVQREKAAKDTLSTLESIDPKQNPEEYKVAFKNYYKAQRKFQRYATRVGYASNNVGSFGNVFSPSTSDLADKLPDVLNSMNSVAADQEYLSAVNYTTDFSEITRLIAGI